MIIGHAALGVYLGIQLGERFGVKRRDLTAFVTTCLVFSVLPDVDILVGLLNLVYRPTEVDLLWKYAQQAHRDTTHSMVIHLLSSALLYVSLRYREANLQFKEKLDNPGNYVIVLFVSLLLSYVVSVVVGTRAAVSLMFLLLFSIIGLISRHESHLSNTHILLASLTILLHPLGDVFTGTPPSLLYPIYAHPVPESRVSLFNTLAANFYFVVFLEFFLVASALYSLEKRGYVRYPADGVGFVPALISSSTGVLFALWLPTPSVDSAQGFVFPVISAAAVISILKYLVSSDSRAVDLPITIAYFFFLITFSSSLIILLAAGTNIKSLGFL